MTKNDIICTGCPKGCRVTVEVQGESIVNIKGYECFTGKDYALNEYKNPTRILTTTVRIKNGKFPLVPVKTAKPIPKSMLLKAMEVIAKTEVTAPIKIGDIIIENILNISVELTATGNIDKKSDC